MVNQKYSASLVVGDYMNSLLFDGFDLAEEEASIETSQPVVTVNSASVKAGYELDTIWRGQLTGIQNQIRDFHLISMAKTLPNSRLRSFLIQSVSISN